MENSWQRKCDSILPSPSMAAEPQNPVFNGGFHFNSSVQEKPTSSAHRMATEALHPWTPSMNYYNSDHTGLGSSLLSLLSGAQCITPAEVQIASSNASGNVVSLVPSGLLSQNVVAGSNLSSVISSKSRVCANHGSKSGHSNDLQGAHMNIENLDLHKAGMHQNLSSSENGPLFSFPGVGYVNGSIPSNARKLYSYDTGALHKPDPPLSCSSSTLTTDCPRVFCLNLSGDLLLSNTGLFGVVCSCHGFHMSIAKFSEHSGLSNVNPGDAVRLDSGETIAQWRKVYFHKFGIKSPEDHCGWDWPEGLSVSAGLVKHFPTASSVSKNCDLCYQDNSLASVQIFNLWNNTICPKNFHSVQKVPEHIVHNEKQRNAQECLSSSLKNNLHSVAKNQKMRYVTSESSTMSNLAGLRGPDHACQPVSPYMLPISESGGPSVFHTHLQNLKTLGKDTGTGRFSDSLAQRDVVSSNVELRLGQPSQQRQSSIQPTLGSHIICNHREPPNKFFLEQHIPERFSKSVEDRRQHSYLASCISASSRRTEKIQFHHGISNNMPNAFQIEQFKGDAPGGSVVAHLKHPLDRRIHLKSINHVVNGSHVMVQKGQSESPNLKTGQFSFPLFRGETSDRGFSSNLLSSGKPVNHENVGSAIGSSQCAAALSFGSHAKAKGRMWSFSRGENVSDHKVYSAGKDENTVMCHFTGGMTDEPDRGNTFNYMGQALYSAQNGELVSDASGSFNSPWDFKRIPPTQAVQMGLPETNSHSFQSLTPLFRKENIGRGPKLTDENASMSLMQHAAELYNQNHPTTYFEAILEQDRLRNFCGKSQVHIGSSVSDKRINDFCGKSQVHTGSSVSKKRINETNYDSLLKTSEVATQCFPSAKFPSSDNATLPPVTDELSNFSLLSKGGYHHGKAEIQNQFVSDMQSTGQPFLRLGGTENISPSSEAGEFPQRCLPRKHNFAVRTNSLTGRYDQRGKTVVAERKDQEGNTGNGIATLLGPELGENWTFADFVNSLNHNENMEQNRKKAEFNSFLWRDVPRKVVGKCSLSCVENFADSSNKNIESKTAVAAEAAGKCYNESVNDGGSFKVQEMSNVSSGCSAPVVTQSSQEANTKDSSTVDAEDTRDAGNPVMDEGSGIDRCWSSDDGIDSERNVEFPELNLGHKGPSKPLLSKPNSSLIDELRFRDSLRLRKLQQQSHTGNCIQEKDSLMQKSARDTKIWKRRPVKWKKLTSSFCPPAMSVFDNDTLGRVGDAELQSHPVKDMKMLFPCSQGNFESCPSAAGRNIKQRSILSLSTDISHDRDACRIHHVEEDKPNIEMDLNDNCECSEEMGRKRLRLNGATQAPKQIHLHRSKSAGSEVAVKETPTNCNMTSSQPVNISQRPRRPVVCEKYGVIANGNPLKPAKIVSLRMLLEAPIKCRLADANKEDLSSVKLLKMATIKGNNGSLCKSSEIKKEVNGNIHHHNELNPQHSMDEMKTACCTGSKEYDNVSHVMKKRRCDGKKAQATPDSCQITEVTQKHNEVPKRNLHELTTKENHSSHVKFPIMKDVKSVPQTKIRFLCKLVENAEAHKISANEISNAKISTEADDFFCCVCGSSSKDENNDLLECSRCLIKVHQACYGVSRVPKANWYCRPCKTSSNNIACVLCGYGGGAMTRALRSQNVVKSLLPAWNIKAESTAENTSWSACLENQIKLLSSSNSAGEGNPSLEIRSAHKELYEDSISTLSHGPTPVEHKRDAITKTDKGEEQDREALSCNSIIAGVLDSTVKQWVHMVCGLWTPTTRCPNVDTMSAFDVSGACTYGPYVVCSICERQGGSCIQCRVVGCNVRFHPWCAHQKGLLQSEVEGDDNESVGFYGRCLRHSMNQDIEPDSNNAEKKLTCARTEGYKGRKQDGIHYNLPPYSDGCGGSPFVPQEQLDAWIHINRQKPHGKRPRKLSASEIKHDSRKEYARYKQSRGWKHLVVYKSGIHGLGLYTSQFIPHGAMVVEYVGEIVGSRVADKRETEYHSGKKLQYKSACYFFRIDKEYIVDATRKGGIARFVNHSCKPNCVAEIISVRNEKKVVFFAERDIYPGEEITYDYHFNHEDEGEKIPCYCNSKNCRRYLN